MIADKQLTRMIEKGKPLSVIRKKVEALALAEDKAEWTANKQAEYNELYPTYILIEKIFNNQEEADEFINNKDFFNTPRYDYEALKLEYNEPIDYSEDETYLTLQEYMDETRVVQEAVEATYDEDGMVLTEAVAEVTESVRPYVAKDVADIVDAYVNSKYKELRAKEYPPIEDYVDAVVKDDAEAIEAYIEACLAVKVKYPKVRK